MMDDGDLHKRGLLPLDPKEGTKLVPSDQQPTTMLSPISEVLAEALDRAERRRAKLEKPIILPWQGMTEQSFQGGMWPGVHVLVGGTGAGKTTWALQLALSAARSGSPVAYVGLELNRTSIGMRLLGECSEPHVPWSDLFLGKATKEEMHRATAASQRLGDLPIYIQMSQPNGWPISSLEPLVSQLRELHPEPNGPGSLPLLIVLDFLQLIGDELTETGRPARLDLRERIGRASYVASPIAAKYNAVILLVSSAARDKYAILSGACDEAGLRYEPDRNAKGQESTVPGRRYVLNADSVVGLGKESGEIEYSADSVTVAIRWPEKVAPPETSILFVTAKGRPTGASWCELRFNGYRFTEAADHGRAIAQRILTRPSERQGPAGGRGKKPPSAATPEALDYTDVD
jgi:hypothetical protein